MRQGEERIPLGSWRPLRWRSCCCFFTAPLQYFPMAALGAVLVVAGLSLIDIRSLRLFYQIDRTEAVLSALAILGVVAVGAVNAILFAVVLALLRFIKSISRPRVEILGKIEGLPGLHSLERHEGRQEVPGVLLFRFKRRSPFSTSPALHVSCCEPLMRRDPTYVTSFSTCFRLPTSMRPDCSPSPNWCGYLRLAAYY
jgi:MFS superfamily sulfate permease-like transporter